MSVALLRSRRRRARRARRSCPGRRWSRRAGARSSPRPPEAGRRSGPRTRWPARCRPPGPRPRPGPATGGSSGLRASSESGTRRPGPRGSSPVGCRPSAGRAGDASARRHDTDNGEPPVQQWGAERIEELTALVAAAAPDDDLTADELLTALYDQPGVVLGPDDGTGVVAVGVGRDPSGALVASLRLVAVHPERRRSGVGDALLEAAEAWAADRGAERIELGGLLAFPLWPGVDPAGGLVRPRRPPGLPRRGRDPGLRRALDLPLVTPEGVVDPSGRARRRRHRGDPRRGLELAPALRRGGPSPRPRHLSRRVHHVADRPRRPARERSSGSAATRSPGPPGSARWWCSPTPAGGGSATPCSGRSAVTS